MITLEEVIIQNSSIKEARLFLPSKKAMENPSNGITIIVPAAEHVIRDCASLANQYIPHYVFGMMANPFSILNKKISLEQVQDFVNRSATNIATFQLLRIILDKGRNVLPMPNTPQNSLKKNIYGDYDEYASDQPQHSQKHDEIYMLSTLFGII